MLYRPSAEFLEAVTYFPNVRPIYELKNALLCHDKDIIMLTLLNRDSSGSPDIVEYIFDKFDIVRNKHEDIHFNNAGVGKLEPFQARLWTHQIFTVVCIATLKEEFHSMTRLRFALPHLLHSIMDTYTLTFYYGPMKLKPLIIKIVLE
jgi:hypothetical protein